MRELPVRLEPGADPRRSLEEIGRSRLPNGAFVVCGVGSVESPRLRLATAECERHFTGGYEILTLSGTVSKDGAHLHMSIASPSGEVFGGHVVYGNVVRTTAELLLVEVSSWSLARELDPETGFLELRAKPLDSDGSAAQPLAPAAPLR